LERQLKEKGDHDIIEYLSIPWDGGWFNGDVKNGRRRQPHGYGIYTGPAVRSEGQWANGKKHGAFKEWSVKTGLLLFEGAYKEDRKDGTVTEYYDMYHDRCNVKFEGMYKRGKKDGPAKEYWFENCANMGALLTFEGAYKDGKREGPAKECQLYGYRNVLVFDGAYRNDKRDGPAKEYSEHGRLTFEGASKDGKREGPAKEHRYPEKLVFDGAYRNDKRDGPAKEYNDQGRLTFDGVYADGKQQRQGQ